MIVGMHRKAGFELAGPVGDHLVGVHVGAGAGAGLEDVQHKVLVQQAVRDFLSRLRYHLGAFRGKQPQLRVDFGGVTLYQAQSPQEGARKAKARNRKVVGRAGGLRAVEHLFRNVHFPHGISLDAVCHRLLLLHKKAPDFSFFVIRGFGFTVFPEIFQELRLKNLI